jgi:hypothetical protein
MRWARYVARMGDMRNAYRILIGKHEGKRPFERAKRRWYDNIRMNILYIGWEGVEWIHEVQVRDQWRALVNKVINLQVS